MPAHQAGDLSSVDPGTSLKVPILGATPTHSAGPLDPLYHQAGKEMGQQARFKLDRKKNGLTLGVPPSRLGSCFLQEDPG